VTRFAFIDREKAYHDIAQLYRVLNVSRFGYYAWRSRRASKRAVEDEVLTTQIRTAFDDNRRVYGAPHIHAELTEAGLKVGRKRVARLLRAAEIVGCHRHKRSFSITRQNLVTDVAPDRVDRRFVATEPNQLWVADVTYVPTIRGWLYPAGVTDVFSRMVIGWSMASHRKTDLVVDAVTMAVRRRGGHVPGVIHHSDRGGEYSSHALERELRRHGALASMGSVADCFDNALAESVFATLERELFDQQPGGRFSTRRTAKLAVFDYLETFYNPRRRHSALGNIAPAVFEERHTLTTAA
jgi:putative transposase